MCDGCAEDRCFELQASAAGKWSICVSSISTSTSGRAQVAMHKGRVHAAMCQCEHWISSTKRHSLSTGLAVPSAIF